MMLKKIATVIVSMMLILSRVNAHLRATFQNDIVGKPFVQRSLASTMLDFSNYMAGDVVTDLGDGITVCVAKYTKENGMVNGQAMIFDSSNVTGGDDDLGTPHLSFGGPGIGKGGKKGLFQNGEPKGNVLIISTDENSTDPNDHALGGIMMFTFDPPRDIGTIGLLDNENGVVFMTCTVDGDVSMILNEQGDNNSFENVHIGKPQVTTLFIALSESGGITDITFEKPVCENDITDLQSFATGTVLSDLGGGVNVTAFDLFGASKEAMVFNSSAPTGSDEDLGTPHESFGGPGVGRTGMKGRLFENSEAKGNLIIISEDDDSSDPDDDARGGVLLFEFDPPRDIGTVGLLDNESGTLFEVTSSDGSSSFLFNENGGDNSYENVAIGKPQVTKLIVHLLGSGAITDVTSCPP